jgi:hypothetical protein
MFLGRDDKNNIWHEERKRAQPQIGLRREWLALTERLVRSHAGAAAGRGHIWIPVRRTAGGYVLKLDYSYLLIRQLVQVVACTAHHSTAG